MSDLVQVSDAATFLFVPGSRPDRFDKAVASGADVVILDLEDTVASHEKDGARRHVSEWLAQGGRAAVRVNGVGSEWFVDDVEAARRARAIVLPKTESADDLRRVADAVPAGTGVVALVESARGVMAAQDICSGPGVVRVGLGNVDLAADLGVEPSSRAALQAARSLLVYASRAAGIAPPIDGVTTNVDDAEIVADDAQHARDLGFTAKLTIHPRQVSAVASVMEVTREEIAWARAVLRTTEDAVGKLDGHMVDEPVFVRARALLRRSAAERREMAEGRDT